MINKNSMVRIAWWGLHGGEEPPLVGQKGAGTIFFSGCNLHCVYCQNYQISQEGIGENYSLADLVKIMLKLQNQGAVNIDLVTPTIWTESIKIAIIKAKKQGLSIPVVWNSNAYEDVTMLKKLQGLVDIYLPDFKYGIDKLGQRYSGIKNYPEKAKKALREMLKQVGHLRLSSENIAQKGVIVRHLILPNNLENSFRVLDYLQEIDNKLWLSLLAQYEPLYQAKDFSEINRNITPEELETVLAYAEKLGFHRGWTQKIGSNLSLLPDFTKANPFN